MKNLVPLRLEKIKKQATKKSKVEINEEYKRKSS